MLDKCRRRPQFISDRCVTSSTFGWHMRYTVFRKKHPLTFSSISPWKMFRFIWSQNNVTDSKEYSTFTSMEYFIHLKHSLKILYKSKHFPERYGRKREWLFFLNTVYNLVLTKGRWCVAAGRVIAGLVESNASLLMCLWPNHLPDEDHVNSTVHFDTGTTFTFNLCFYFLCWYVSWITKYDPETPCSCGLYCSVTSSEKVDKENRYSDFLLSSIPYPGCEFFRDWKDSGYRAEGLVFDWRQVLIGV